MDKRAKKKATKKEIQKELKQIKKYRREILIIAIVLTALILIISGTKIVLYANLLLGNDILLTLEADKEKLTSDQEENVTFTASVTTNLFCKAICDYQLLDVSNNKTMDNNEFNLSPALPLTKTYTITKKQHGEGMELYRFSISCKSEKSFFCHTSELSMERSRLITSQYNLSENQEMLKNRIRSYLQSSIVKIEDLKGQEKVLINYTNKTEIGLLIQDAEDKIDEMYAKWKNYNFELNPEMRLLNQKINTTTRLLDQVNQTATLIIQEKNDLTMALQRGKEELTELILQQIPTIEIALQIDEEIKNFNSKIIPNLTDINLNLQKEIDKKRLETDISYDLLCNQTGTCISTNIAEVCSYAQSFVDLNITEPPSQNYTNLTIWVQPCPQVNFTEISNQTLTIIELPQPTPISIDLTIQDPIPQCCIFGKCTDCCMTKECQSKNTPVIFLHGHAFNKENSAEYSLEGFNQIQERLEKDNYFNAGTVTLYTMPDINHPWSLIPRALLIETSYYFDVFKQTENSIIIQTKSENIDTYAIRLKEIIDIIKFNTGAEKVDIVAYSMGGLVARRYIQIFGEQEVQKLILIASPNKGIVGNTLKYCPLVGEKLECRDMNSESLFINKLNSKPLPNIPIYNIIGTGCDMKVGMGDGIVLKENAILEGVKNYIVNGTCSGRLDLLHTSIKDIDRYPEVYDIIKEALAE